MHHVTRRHVAHVVGHGAEDSQRGEGHDEIGVLEHGLSYAIEEGQYRLAPLAHLGERDAEEGRENHHREDVRLGSVLNQIRGEHVKGDLPAGLGLHRRHRGVGAHVHRQVRAGLQPVGHGQADKEGQGRDHFEVEEGLAAHAAHGLHVAGLRNAHNDGGEQQGDDEALDEADESFGKEAEAIVGPGVLVLGQAATQKDTQGEAGEDPHRAGPVTGSFRDHGIPIGHGASLAQARNLAVPVE